jgi:GNAT superfamily N-acetyltransferase
MNRSASAYVIRPATVSDAAVVARHRVDMFCAMGQVPSEELAGELLEASTAALTETLRDGSYRGWLAVDAQGRVLAGAGVHIKTQLPRISHERLVATGPVPLAVNVFTEPDSRRRGIAHALMTVMMEWAKAQGFDRMVLHASHAARPLYQSLGFVTTNEMRWSIDGL